MAMKCTTCDTEYEDAAGYREHCRDLWHTYNLKRKVAGLGPLPLETWNAKQAAAAEKAEAEGKLNAKPKGGVKKPPQPKKESAPWDTLSSLFDDNKSESVEENVEYMNANYSFFIPDREYLKQLPELLTYLHEKIEDDYTCVFCNKIFGSAASCKGHMLDKNHTRIGTDSEVLLGEISPFYDFTSSKSELVKNLAGKFAQKPKDDDEESSTSPDSEDGGEDKEGNWEDCSNASDASDVLEVVECEDEDEFAAVLAEYGLQRTEVLESGDLRLPSGAVATHRKYAYVYKQKFHHTNVQTKIAQKQLALSMGGLAGGGGRGMHGVAAVAVGKRMVKTHSRQVMAILRESQRQWMKLGISQNKGDRCKYQSKVKVNLYTWAK